MATETDALRRLHEVLDGIGAMAVAVSGGVDSLTLATAAHRHAGARVEVFHAVSAAVPPEATRRVQALAARESWRLRLVRPGELERPDYVANPVDRCLHCKRALYTTIAATLAPHTDAQLLSGANLDDLGDYRPGLQAARESGVRHPLVEAGIDKATVRALARRLGLGGLAELPASPCLSSRVETGIAITAPMLGRIDAAERLLREDTGAADVRCRVRQAGVVLEIDPDALARLGDERRERLAGRVAALFGADGAAAAPRFEAYRRGSAFLRNAHD
jgi:uncharacterized protein